MKFTVILIYPDYIADQYGDSFYSTYVDTPDSYEGWELCDHQKYALYLAQKDAWDAQEYDDEENRHPEDFALVAMLQGHHELTGRNAVDSTEDLHDADRDAIANSMEEEEVDH